MSRDLSHPVLLRPLHRGMGFGAPPTLATPVSRLLALPPHSTIYAKPDPLTTISFKLQHDEPVNNASNILRR